SREEEHVKDQRDAVHTRSHPPMRRDRRGCRRTQSEREGVRLHVPPWLSKSKAHTTRRLSRKSLSRARLSPRWRSVRRKSGIAMAKSCGGKVSVWQTSY